MIINTALTLALAAALLAPIAMTRAAHAQAVRPTVTVKHRPIVSPGDVSGSWDARQNVIDSKRYEQLLATNPAFRLGFAWKFDDKQIGQGRILYSQGSDWPY